MIVPKKKFFNHHTCLPNSDSAHWNAKGFTSRLNGFSIPNRHGFAKGASHNPRNTGHVSGTKSNHDKI